jgi:hypothetical protein
MYVPFSRFASLFTVLTVLAVVPTRAGWIPTPRSVSERFETNPLTRAEVVLEGDALARLTWNDDAPAFPGDGPGSLTALYDSRRPAGRIGWPLPSPWSESDAFRASAVFVIDPDGLVADPFGFFQISWSLWNSGHTGLERTGNFSSFAADTFELVEFAYFPNVSPFFGGPFLSPSAFGVADPDNPAFDFLGGFVNFSFGSAAVELPVGQPLVTVLSHRPAEGILVASVATIDSHGVRVPVPGATVVVPLGSLPVREYSLDTVGLTLWHDGFGGDPPSLRAEVVFHEISAAPAVPAAPADR